MFEAEMKSLETTYSDNLNDQPVCVGFGVSFYSADIGLDL